MEKIISIGSASAGLNQLLEKSAKAKETKIIGKKEETCLLLHVPFQNKSYFVPGDQNSLTISPAMFQKQMLPVFAYGVAVCYSEGKMPEQGCVGALSINGGILIQRHEDLQISSTGIITETVKVPSWWSRRDEGVI